MEIVPLDSALEPIFWEHVNQDICHYFFFALDWKYAKDVTKILLALEGNRIDGMMIIHRQEIVQLRGGCEAVNALLEKLDLEEVELQALEQHKPYILERYKPTVSYKMILMTLHEGEERLQINHPVVKLAASDAEQIVTIMKNADPEFWGTVTHQQIVEQMNCEIWLGIKVDGELVSVSNANLTEWGGHIGVVATHENHRNQGYATSVASELVKQILEQQFVAMLFVLSDELSPPAMHVYKKVGFKPYRTYFFMRGERD